MTDSSRQRERSKTANELDAVPVAVRARLAAVVITVSGPVPEEA